VNLFSFANRHFAALAMIAVMAVLAGLTAGAGLPVGLFPNVSFPRIVVSVESGEMPADEMVVRVTRPIEEALAAVPSIAGVRSTTSRGATDVAATFDWGSDMTRAVLMVSAAVNQTQAFLPTGTHFEVRRMDPTIYPVLGYGLASTNRSQRALREYAAWTLRPVLLRVPGVARVNVLGGALRELQVNLDPESLRASKVSPKTVLDAIMQGQTLDAAGLMEAHHQLYLSMTDGRATTPLALADRAISTGPGGQSVRIGELGTVSEGEAPHWTRVRTNGKEGIMLEVMQQPGASTLTIQDGIQAALKSDAGKIPADIQLMPFYDQAALIREAENGVRDAILIGIALGIGVIGIFLRRWRLTLLAALAVPLALATTLLPIAGLNLGLNVMTLGGLAAAVGLVLDDAIVMLEHIASNLADGRPPMVAAADATRELTVPFIGSSMCSIVVFAPMAFLSGVTGSFFRFLSLTMVSALVISLFASLVILPPLAARVLDGRDSEKHRKARHPGIYTKSMAWLLRNPWLTTVVLGGLIVATGLLYNTLPNGFLPDMDEGSFTLDYHTPPGTALADTDRSVELIEKILGDTPDVASYARRTGLQMGGALTEANSGDIVVRLKSGKRRDIDVVKDDIRTRIQAAVPAVRPEFAQLMEDMIGDLTAVPQPVEIKVLGADLRLQEDVARKVNALIQKMPGVVDSFDGITEAGPGLRAVVEPGAAGRYGLTPIDVASAMTAAVEGEPAGAVLSGGQVLPVRMRVNADLSSGATALAELPVSLPTGGIVRLGDIARIVEDPGTTEISREHLAQMVAVTARIEGAGLSATVDAIRTRISKSLPLPAGITLEYGGLYAEQQDSFRGLLLVIIAGFVLVLITLMFTLRRFGAAFAVLIIDVASLFGVVAALAVTGTKLNISSMMGAIMIVGIVAENAVFLIYVADRHRGKLSIDDALIAAGRERRRPVIMTTLAAILALVPLALGLGAGAQLQRPLAIAVIGGFVLSSLLILVALPVVYRMFAKRGWEATPIMDGTMPIGPS
jgi:multidrug efflux pump subunit AcrB